jgi:hypothetical protein
MTTPTLATIEADAKAVLPAIIPFLPPNISLALTMVQGVLSAVQSASTSGADITDLQLTQLFSLDDAAKAADLAAQQAAHAGQKMV